MVKKAISHKVGTSAQFSKNPASKPTTCGRKLVEIYILYNRMKLRSGLPNVTKIVKPVKSSIPIIAAVLENNGEDDEHDDDELSTRILHIDARNAFEIALQYIGQHSSNFFCNPTNPTIPPVPKVTD